MVYETDKDFSWIQLESKNNGSSIHVSEKQNQVQFESATVKHNVFLRVNDSLNTYDTLYFGATMNGTQFTLTGPFKDGQVIPIEIWPNIGVYAGSDFIPADRAGKGLFWWGLGWEEYQKVSSAPNFQVPPNMIRGPLQPVCGQGEDIIVDLRGKTGE